MIEYDDGLSDELTHRLTIPTDDPRLGRWIEHDERSRAYVAEQASELRSVSWARRVGVYDQGNVGSCTGNAMAGLLMTDPHARPDLVADQGVALLLYALATRADGFPGVYPARDTGSSGLAVCKAAKVGKLISGYRHAFGIDQALRALTLGPVITGIDWHEGFDQPNADGIVEATGAVRGGHEFVVDRLILERELVGATNSWGMRYGQQGRFYFSFETWDALLRRGGDVTTAERREP